MMKHYFLFKKNYLYLSVLFQCLLVVKNKKIYIIYFSLFIFYPILYNIEYTYCIGLKKEEKKLYLCTEYSIFYTK